MGITTVMLCTDGSETARRAVVAGFAILQPAERVIVATVVDEPDEMDLTGTGFAGGVLTSDQFAELDEARHREGRTLAERTAALLAPANVEIQILRGRPGPTLCEFAGEFSADALVVGSRGHGLIKRALLGSVSEYVIRNAPCPVVVSGPAD